MLLETFLLLQTDMPNNLYDDIPPWARLGFTATVLAKLTQPGILQHLTFLQQLDNVHLFPQNYSHSSQILVTQRCTACKEKARRWSSASPCHDRGAIFLELWMASPHPSPWGADPIDGKPGVPEAHLWYLDGAHTKAWSFAHFPPFRTRALARGNLQLNYWLSLQDSVRTTSPFPTGNEVNPTDVAPNGPNSLQN